MSVARDDLVELTRKWMEYVGGDPHKDRDCHFYVYTDFAYGDKPVYKIRHYGYIGEDFEENYPTYEMALKGLERRIRQMIEGQREWVDGVLKEGEPTWDEYQVKKAHRFNILFPAHTNKDTKKERMK